MNAAIVGEDYTFSGRLFHTLGAAYENAQCF